MPTRRLHLVSADEDHRVSTIELFFDLVFVYAITQTTQLMADHLSPLGVGQGLAMLAVLWWCWCSYAWLGTTIHVDHGIARLAMFGAMAVMFLVSLTIPEAFVDHPGGLFAPVLFVVCYALVRLLHLVAYLGAARHDPGLKRVLLRMFVGLLPSVILLGVATALSGPWQLGLWVVALLVDYLNVYLTGPDGWRLNSPAHFAERFGLIVIIALGESIVAIGIGIGALPMSWPVTGAAVCGLALAAGMWWTYFDVVARVSEHRLTRATGRERAKLATDSYTFLHLPLIAGIVLVALGLKKALLYVADTEHHAPGEALHGVPAWTLTGGLALYLIALSSLRKRNLGSWNHQRLVIAVLLVAATPLLEHVPAAVLVLIVAAVVLALIAFERLQFAEWRKQVHAEHS
ncbi:MULTISPECIES: low temperature requirement protein A [unclassified Amycolatopsis]|uniref:low temperature requirement protein A n=1 Tax=unclassified Amycolatopsis TaxID=2618356 RepID=UPI001FF52E56|nr:MULTISPECIES: low temperature requirement protein A [unclassified Amycolatopsis]UOZ07552.1 low temperature requirement protein A [Amycolatopsis sp. WQ 127309]WSJ73808.1 low temperature requirement protein A [Amycolatopsis sp. NBC_01307]